MTVRDVTFNIFLLFLLGFIWYICVTTLTVSVFSTENLHMIAMVIKSSLSLGHVCACALGCLRACIFIFCIGVLCSVSSVSDCVLLSHAGQALLFSHYKP